MPLRRYVGRSLAVNFGPNHRVMVRGAPDRQIPIKLNMNDCVPVLGMSRKLNWSCLVAIFALALSLGSPALSQPSPQNSPVRSDVGRIVGDIDGVSRDGAQTYVSGWACQQGQDASIAVHIYAGTSAADVTKNWSN